MDTQGTKVASHGWRLVGAKVMRLSRPPALLWILLTAGATVLAASPQLPVAVRSPLAANAVVTTALLAGTALFLLGLYRYRLFGRLADLLLGLAFGTLALTNLGEGLLDILRDGGAIRGLDGSYLGLATRLGSALLFFLALVREWPAFAPGTRVTMAWRVGGVVGLLLLGIGAVILSMAPFLPPLVDADARALLGTGAPIADLLGGQSPVLVTVNGLILLLLGGAALGHGLRLREDPLINSFGAVLALLFFGQVMAFLFPPVVRDYVGIGDLFLLVAYLVLLGNLFLLVISEVADRTLLEERLRLSRELHDGLAQELGLLQFHLERASAGESTLEAIGREIDTAKRLTEAASLEARQAIVALRSGPVTWESFLRALENFADEFSLNHHIVVDFQYGGYSDEVTADLQTEVLRLAHEAFSNAIRHGHADHLRVTAHGDSAAVTVTIADNGCGFDPDHLVLDDGDHGVGLQSMRERLARRGGTLQIDSSPGAGVRIAASLPMSTKRAPLHA